MKVELFDADYASKVIGISRPKLFRFLRRYNFINGTRDGLNVAPELLFNGILDTINLNLYVGSGENKLSVKKVMFTTKGLVWLKRIYKLLKPEL
ncbi:hypothetical protein [Lacihabitans soyangensis]|uniref:Antirepressor protein C-terminal domain-containing protein n=1 Tax=Lacihabitans soyangensis TaxID=869394 RepID=A0AAE3KS61_9BACT|nr:hypothetical protein [Lacihabitans soyangensis]MCP9762967.1 hypothetical protein [Lacihabitans soyangensis]